MQFAPPPPDGALHNFKVYVASGVLSRISIVYWYGKEAYKFFLAPVLWFKNRREGQRVLREHMSGLAVARIVSRC